MVALPLLLMAASCAQETVAHQQQERSANYIKVLLARAGITAVKAKDETSRDLRFNVMVAVDQAVAALGVLEEHNLPETRKEDTEAMFKDGGMIPTNTQERAKREVGVTGDIVNSLRQVSRVVDVQAVVSIPEDNPLRDVNEAKPKPKASVIIEYLPDKDNRPPLSVEDVQRFAQAALPEMKATEVSVLLIPYKSSDKVVMGEAGSDGKPMMAMVPENGCEKDRVVGIEICTGSKQKMINMIIVVIVLAGMLSGMAVIAVFRALRYRKDLTRLTAQLQVRK